MSFLSTVHQRVVGSSPIFLSRLGVNVRRYLRSKREYK
jgi:hypothetical protein